MAAIVRRFTPDRTAVFTSTELPALAVVLCEQESIKFNGDNSKGYL
jgi:hypothetical protein